MDFDFIFTLTACFLIYLCIIFLFKGIEDVDSENLRLRIAIYFGCIFFLLGLVVHCIFNIYHEEQASNSLKEEYHFTCIEYQIERGA